MLKELTGNQMEVLLAKGLLRAVNCGLGFSSANSHGRGWVGCNGGAPGVNVATAVFVDDGTAAVVMSNRDPAAADVMMKKVLRMLFDEGRVGG